MRRIIFILLILFLCIPIVVEAHKGKTDSSGGHTDHSTGKYHYHHGYSAHSHYDMDGDGDVDCPYDFDNKTNSNNYNIQSSEQEKADNKTNQKDFVETISVIFQKLFSCVAALALLIMFFAQFVAMFSDDVGYLLVSIGFKLLSFEIPILIINLLLFLFM